MSCMVYGCTSSTTNVDPNIEFYSFPKHPLLAQQWVAACWRSEEFDIETAQMCSIHFDSTCFTSEYKINYMGHYTKVLKYDAIPSLYLPNTQQSIILNTTASPIGSTDIKDIVVYEVQTVPLDTYITLTTNQLVDIAAKKNLDDAEEKYVPAIDETHLKHIRDDNIALQRNYEEYQISINRLREKIKLKRQELKCLNKEINKMSRQLDANRINSMSIAEQKNVLAKVFSEAQIKILSGKKKIYWSNEDMAMGYTIRHISNKRCYLYLSKKLNFPLPALSSLRRWSTVKKNKFNGDPSKEESKFSNDSE